MLDFFKKEDKPTQGEYIRFNTETCEKYVFTNGPRYAVTVRTEDLYIESYELFKAHGKLFLAVKNEYRDFVFNISEECKRPIEYISEIRHILLSCVGLTKEKIDLVIKGFMGQGLVQMTHFY